MRILCFLSLHSSTVSTLKVENVVKAPKHPVKISLPIGDAEFKPIPAMSPIKKEPPKLMNSTADGKIEVLPLIRSVITKRMNVPMQPPSMTAII
jgi:hypothetical protein